MDHPIGSLQIKILPISSHILSLKPISNLSTKFQLDMMVLKNRYGSPDRVTQDENFSNWNTPPTPMTPTGQPLDRSRPSSNSFPNFVQYVYDNSYYTLPATLPNRIPHPTFLNPRGVFLQTKGGIGEQLYQYACHYALARKHNAPLYIKHSNTQRNQLAEKKTRNPALNDQAFALDAFNIPLFPWNTIDDTLPGTVGKDYCQSEAYFAPYQDELRDLFTLRESNGLTASAKSWEKIILEAGNTGETVAVHIRRGDVGRSNFTTPFSFYPTAISRMRQDLILRNNRDISISLFIFSDDANYIRNEFLTVLNKAEGTFNIHIVSDPTKLTSLEEFHIATKCKNFIIPNSTFAWWVAYLGKYPDKIVYAAHLTTEHVKRLYNGSNADRLSFYLWQYKHIYYPIGWNAIYPV
ncbi:O-antigen biosynthesis glycosyltransferase WbnK [Folsomia candida]|uniref:L-Fucosyltransferase n=1 Tax=Folsomia candida TaxID=158441 RepID=A0A226EB24_FOLCA|nr:O-antigen biosynthesis glycosyltransferase WbnK [Folsomia candida]